MVMNIMNNTGVMLTLGQLNKNISKVGKDLQKVSSGMKLNSAGDDASGYAISEKMRVRIRSLDQDEMNVQNGASLLKVASGAIDSIMDELRGLKELALNSANDTNTELDRATLQKEFDHRRANIEDIATGTTYNGKILLDGRYGRRPISITTTTTTVGSSSGIRPTATNTPQPYTMVSTGVAEPTGVATYTVSGNTVTITSDGVYNISTADNNRKIEFADGVKNVKFSQSNPSTAVADVTINAPSSGNANIWLENVNIIHNSNMATKNFIKFDGSGNVLNLKGTNKIFNSNGKNAAVINAGGGLTVEGGQDGTGELSFDGGGMGWGSVIGSDQGEDLGGTNITVNSGSFNSLGGRVLGAFIGAACYASIGNITVNGGTFTEGYDEGDVMIGCGSAVHHANPQSAGDIIIRNATLKTKDGLVKKWDPLVGCSNTQSGRIGNITIENSYIYYRGESSAAIGTGGFDMSNNSPTAGNINISDSYFDVETGTGAGIGSGEHGHVGNITITNCNTDNVKSMQAEDIGKGVNGTCGTVSINESSSGAGSETITTTTTTTTEKLVGDPLKIHHGTKANEALNVYINDMRTCALKSEILDREGKIIDTDDIAYLETLKGDVKAYRAYKDVLKEANGKSLDDASIKTNRDANVAIRIIEGAIDYALDEATTVGAYISRLDYTKSNIVTAKENTQLSESTIRDADLAKEMAEYTKGNVLAQASQSMLAQANQTSASVLSLLQ